MIDLYPSDEEASSDIDAIFDAGINAFAATFDDSAEGLFRLRRAYDTAWRHVYTESLEAAVNIAGESPTDKIEKALFMTWKMRDNSGVVKYANFAFMCFWTKDKDNEIELLFKEDARYFYEDAYLQALTDLCAHGNLTGDGEYPSPGYTAQLLAQYIASAFITWHLLPSEEGMPVEEAHLGALGILHGHGPTPVS